MKKSRIIAPALALLCVSAAATVTGTVAWFSANRTVTATGMKVKAKAEGSLIITKTTALPTVADTSREVDFEDAAAHELYVSTHDGAEAYSHKLKYVSNTEDVSEETGLAIEGKTLNYAAAVNGTEAGSRQYYVDYTVYLASQSEELTGQTLRIDMDSVSKLTNINGAVSVDFYYVADATAAATDAGTYVGALNVAQLDRNANDASTSKTYFNVSEVKIPKVDSGAAFAVLMRVYVDGELKDSANTTFCKNISSENITDVNLSVKFTTSAAA